MSSVQNALNRADKMKLYLEQKYSKMRKEENEKESRRKSLEDKLTTMGVSENEKNKYREILIKAEADDIRDERKRLTTDDFQALAIIGKGAYGEVRLVQKKEKESSSFYAMKSMLKEAMILKNQISHVKAERDILIECSNNNNSNVNNGNVNYDNATFSMHLELKMCESARQSTGSPRRRRRRRDHHVFSTTS